MGYVYIFLEKFVKYPNDHTILGIPIDEDFQKMSRKELCDYIEKNTPAEGSFWDLDSTSKIRFGAQLLKETNNSNDSPAPITSSETL
tara:strand:+ start:709 stop:969 length:261 start_codon:yes stop_codon:yes gene_type:complete